MSFIRLAHVACPASGAPCARRSGHFAGCAWRGWRVALHAVLQRQSRAARFELRQLRGFVCGRQDAAAWVYGLSAQRLRELPSSAWPRPERAWTAKASTQAGQE
jgi:hypothetical protein